MTLKIHHMIHDINESNFQTQVLESTVPVLVDFWGEYCAPCSAIAVTLEQLASELDGAAKIVKIDAHANASISARYSVRSVPTLLFFHHGQVVDQFIGAHISKDQLKSKLLSPHP